jgi:hypothetical protein
MAAGLVDELAYNEAGNEARLVKHLAPAFARGQESGVRGHQSPLRTRP